VSGGTAITVARRNFPNQFLHYHRAGHGAVTSPHTQRGYTASCTRSSPASRVPAVS
jgi:ribulose-bisphosphate carboxylase large chain